MGLVCSFEIYTFKFYFLSLACFEITTAGYFLIQPNAHRPFSEMFFVLQNGHTASFHGALQLAETTHSSGNNSNQHVKKKASSLRSQSSAKAGPALTLGTSRDHW